MPKDCHLFNQLVASSCRIIILNSQEFCNTDSCRIMFTGIREVGNFVTHTFTEFLFLHFLLTHHLYLLFLFQRNIFFIFLILFSLVSFIFYTLSDSWLQYWIGILYISDWHPQVPLYLHLSRGRAFSQYNTQLLLINCQEETVS